MKLEQTGERSARCRKIDGRVRTTFAIGLATVLTSGAAHAAEPTTPPAPAPLQPNEEPATPSGTDSKVVPESTSNDFPATGTTAIEAPMAELLDNEGSQVAPQPGAPAFIPLPPPPLEAQPPASTGAEALPATAHFGTDTRSGHFYVAAGGALVAPFGEIAQGVNQFARTGPGFAPSLDLGFGVSRSVSVGAYGTFALFGGGRLCENCSSTSLGAGAFVRYHLVTGLRLDPWVSFGIGARTFSSTLATGESRSYSGIEWARVQLGGDWSLTNMFALGPFLGLGAGTFFGDLAPGENRDDTTPTVSASPGGVHWRLEAGLRASFDFPGK